jgi:hypothetical protein
MCYFPMGVMSALKSPKRQMVFIQPHFKALDFWGLRDRCIFSKTIIKVVNGSMAKPIAEARHLFISLMTGRVVMRKHNYSIFLVLVNICAALILCLTPAAHALHQITIPYSYVGDGWDTVIVISNTSGKTISPILWVRNGPDTADSACKNIDSLENGEIFVSTFGAISGWNRTPPIPGIFQVTVTVNELGSSDSPFGAAVAINNSTWGGFGFQQFLSEYAGSAMAICVYAPIPVL